MARPTRFLSFFTIVLGIWLVFHLYVGFRLWSLIEKPIGHRFLVLVIAAGFVLYPVGRILHHNGWVAVGWSFEYAGALWMGMMLLIIPALAVVDGVTLFGLILKTWVLPLRLGGVVAALLLTAIGWIGGIIAPKTVDIEVEMPRLPVAADGLVLVQLSDLHLGTLIGSRRLNAVVSQIQAMNPDVVVITGDLIDSDAHSVAHLVEEMSRLQAPLGVFSILGNHDVYAGADASIQFMREAGFSVLDGSAAEITTGLWVVGIRDGAPIRSFEQAMSQIDDGSSVIYLQHAPGNEAEVASAGVGLMLDGHTHGAQIWPAHYLVRFVYPFLAGVRQIGEMTQVVCRGAGQWGPPIRLFAPSEIYRITLRSKGRRGEGEVAR